jgi:hypothetical protein
LFSVAALKQLPHRIMQQIEFTELFHSPSVSPSKGMTIIWGGPADGDDDSDSDSDIDDPTGSDSQSSMSTEGLLANRTRTKLC